MAVAVGLLEATYKAGAARACMFLGGPPTIGPVRRLLVIANPFDVFTLNRGWLCLLTSRITFAPTMTSERYDVWFEHSE